MKVLKSGYKKFICEHCALIFVNKEPCIEHEIVCANRNPINIIKEDHNMSNQTAILITGMSRSGTSCVGGVCERLGIYMGEEADLVAADTNNKEGYYEHKDLITANRKILKSFGFDRITITQSIASAKTNDEQINEIIDYCYEKNFKNESVFGLKDPRLCLTYTQWIHFFRKKGIKYKIIHVYRNPDEVLASSLKALGGSKELWSYLWKFYNIEIMNGIAYNMLQDYTFIDYNELLYCPTSYVMNLSDFVYGKQKHSGDLTKIRKAVGFLDNKLRNYKNEGNAKDAGAKFIFDILRRN